MMITEMLARNARMYGNEIALVEREPEKNKRREITWQEFDDQSHQLARSLLKKGVKKGDRVVLLMRNCLEWLPIYFGILRTGALAVPLNFLFAAKPIKHCTETAGARASQLILFPLVLCIFPAIFVVVLGPTILNFLQQGLLR